MKPRPPEIGPQQPDMDAWDPHADCREYRAPWWFHVAVGLSAVLAALAFVAVLDAIWSLVKAVLR